MSMSIFWGGQNHKFELLKNFLSGITYLIDLLNYLSDLLNKIFIFRYPGHNRHIIHENVRNCELTSFFIKYLSKSLNCLSYELKSSKKGEKLL